MPAWYCTSTTSRYLLPPMLNTTRLLPQMLALAYWSLMSCGLRQVALIASAYQLCSGHRASAQPGRSQNFCRLLLAMILTAGSISQFGRNGNWHRSRVEASTDLLATATGDISKGPSSDPKVPPLGSKLVDIWTLRRRQPHMAAWIRR